MSELNRLTFPRSASFGRARFAGGQGRAIGQPE